LKDVKTNGASCYVDIWVIAWRVEFDGRCHIWVV
jgi:hypothetical protein